jgi:hypothetical protein
MKKDGLSQLQVVLPEPFHDLAPFSGWALAKESERTGKRLASPMEEIRAFYEAVLPRLEAIVQYLNQFPLDHMPGDAQHLLYLTLSLVEVASAVELYGQPGVPNSLDSSRFRPVE